MSRPLTHDTKAYFRTSTCVMRAVEAKAVAQGMSLSEYLRHLVCRDAMGAAN